MVIGVANDDQAIKRRLGCGAYTAKGRLDWSLAEKGNSSGWAFGRCASGGLGWSKKLLSRLQ